jgi:hypothetical protein
MKGIWWSFVLLGAVVFVGAGCDATGSGPDANQDPSVELAENAPVTGDTLFALATLHWDGGDQDGFIDRYEYRTISIYCWNGDCSQGDSVVTDWTTTNRTSNQLAFNSKAEVNKQIFQVRAVDNEGGQSPITERVFYTRSTVPPTTTIGRPVGGVQVFARQQTTDWWQGVRLTFTGETVDKDARIVEYGWGVDDGQWHWTRDTSVVIPPEVFAQDEELEGSHTVQVTARDNTGLVSHEGRGAAARTDTVRVELITPDFNRGLLIIDDTNEDAQGSNISVGDATVDSFYAEAFQPDEVWDYAEEDGPPPRQMLGNYERVLWHADNYWANANEAHSLPEHTRLLSDYMNVGGDLIMSGWRILTAFRPGADWESKGSPQVFREGTFVRDYLHIAQARSTPKFPSDFIGAFGISTGFADVSVDSAKLADTFFFSDGQLGQVDIIVERANFTEVVYSYRSAGDYPAARGSTVGHRYRGTAYDAVVFGFPLYFLHQEDANRLAQDVLGSLEG